MRRDIPSGADATAAYYDDELGLVIFKLRRAACYAACDYEQAKEFTLCLNANSKSRLDSDEFNQRERETFFILAETLNLKALLIKRRRLLFVAGAATLSAVNERAREKCLRSVGGYVCLLRV